MDVFGRAWSGHGARWPPDFCAPRDGWAGPWTRALEGHEAPPRGRKVDLKVPSGQSRLPGESRNRSSGEIGAEAWRPKRGFGAAAFGSAET
ncbi:hypothetical protein NDU88_006095 [Pleurodeles waltl]|uniref:Uncharacterized protein n=1 Tax=Pleurodeles waltl TaxID=8319 RepID=A0AAV7NQU4_PLEWA|nr:hypothetical protein NDU88_006095 [Pleurodeles waltl]